MKRFYCTVCRKIKRVQKWPTLLENRESPAADTRIGECNHHRNPSLVFHRVTRTRTVVQPVLTSHQSMNTRKQKRAR